MPRFNDALRIFLCFSLVLTGLFPGSEARAQDIIASDDIAGGASVFVFRESRKKPQERAATAKGFMSRGKSGTVSRRKLDNHIAANWRRKRTPTMIAKGKPRPGAAARRIALSKTQTAAADKLLDNKETDTAIATYREAVKNDPKNTNASSGLSEALTAKGIAAAGESGSMDAIAYLDEAVKLDPKNDVAYAKLGEIYDANEQTPKAIANYENALRANERFSAVYVPLGLAYIKTGEIAKAESFAAKASTEGPETAELEFLRGLILYRQNKNSEALAAFDKTIQLDSDYVSAYYYRGQVFDRMERQDNAIASYQAVVAKDPGYAPAYYDMGVVYYNSGQYDKAVASYQESLKYDESNGLTHANLASAYRQLERYPEANGEYAMAESHGVKNPDLYSEWGYCLGKTKEWDKSTARLEEARTLSPTAIDNTNVGWGYYNAAQADKAAKNDAEATAKLQKSKMALTTATEQNPKLDAAYMNLGSTNNALGEYDAAVAALNTALSLHNDWVIALNQLGLGYRGLKNLGQAIAQFNRVVNIDGNNITGLFNLGSAQYASGDKKSAKKTQERLKKLRPDLAEQLGMIIAGKVINEAEKQIKKAIKVPFPY
jgi:tetratricopeptide (TPR) repeat protein